MLFGKSTVCEPLYYFYAAIGRYGQQPVGLPGDLGPRPIDLHLKAFLAMGAATDQSYRHGWL